jgi:hypothetical protein
MASLTTHLRQPGDHGRLAFHPECPMCCRERLVGALPAEALVSRRTQALLAAGVLALSTTTPTAVLAAEPDQEQEGAAAPDPANGDPGSDPDFDPGGDSTDLPFDAGPAPEAQSAPAREDDDSIALEQEPATNDDAPVADPGDGTSTPNAGQQQARPTTDPAPPAAEAPMPQPSSEPPSSAPAPETPTAPPAPSDTDAAARTETRERETTREKPSGTDATGPSQTDPAAPALQPEPVHLPTRTSPPTTVQVAQTQPASPSAAVSQVRGAQRGDRFHVVRRGESLWSIAKGLLGDRASAARIAREVNRLWELNSDRIGTGDRDLLMIGTRLALR